MSDVTQAMNMRLLYLTAETCPTFRADLEVLFGKYLPRHGVSSDIVTARTPGHDGEVAWGGGETRLCDVRGGMARKHIEILLHGIRQVFLADQRKYQAIQVRDMPVLAVFGLLAARMKGLHFFYWMSYPMPEGQIELARERGFSAGMMKFLFPWLRGRIGRTLLYRLVLPLADHVFVQSNRMREDMVERHIPFAKMTPVPMGIDVEAIQSASTQPVNDPRLIGKRVLVYLGTLDRPRRIETLFEMLSLVRQKEPDAVLVLVGDTEDDVHRQWLKDQADKSGVSNAVIWTGWLPMKEGWRYIKSSEVGLSPFPRGFLLDSASPTKVQEYLALGLPVVCNDNPDQEMIIRESGGGICVPYTARDFAAAVIDLLQMSSALRSSMTERGYAYICRNRDYATLSEYVAAQYQKLETTFG